MSRTVVLLGITSLLTDISSEMVTTVLPLYLVFGLGFSPLQFGIVDGLHQGAAALVRVAGGFAGDRWRRYKEVAALGYGLSATARLALPLVGAAWSGITTVVLVDRIGKGIRTAPRDALISLSCSPAALGTAFGVHRALDTTGAMLGPIVAFAVLAAAPGEFDAVFVVSFCFALLGLAVIVLFVQNPCASARAVAARASLGDAARLLASPRFRALVLAGVALGLVTVSDGFLYLGLQQSLSFDETLLPLLFVGTAAVYMILAVPVGRLADRIGHLRVFLAGYAMLLLVYACLLAPAAGAPQLFALLLLLGAFYAATDGVLMALASSMLPTALRGTGLAVLVTATSLARLFSSIVFGAAWTWAGADAAIIGFAAGLVVVMGLAAVGLRTRPKEQAVA